MIATTPRLTLVPLLVIALLLLAVPAGAGATLVYSKNPFNASVFVAADDGSDARRIGKGSLPRVSPDGETVVYLGAGQNTRLRVTAAAGGPTRTLISNWQEPFLLAFSPDSQSIAVLRGAEIGRRTLVVIDLASGAQRVLARGYFSGFSFDPGGSGELVYARSNSEAFPVRSDIFRVAPGGKPVRLTGDRRSQDPLWGPNGRIVFVKQLGAKQRRFGPKNELFLMNPRGKQTKRLTRTKVGPLLLGLTPTDWSADGKHLLAEFVGQDTSYAVRVNPRTGAQRPVQKTGENGFVGAALSADGRLVLGTSGGFEPGPDQHVGTVPYRGGGLKVLVRRALTPDWSR